MSKVRPYSSDSIFKSFWKFILLNVGIATFLIVVLCPQCLTSWEGLRAVFPDFVFSFLISSCLSFGGYWTDTILDSRLPWVKFPLARLLVTAIVYIIYCLFFSYLIVLIVSYLKGQFELSNIPWKALLEFTKTPVIIGLCFMAFFTARSWLYEWRNAAIEAEQLKSENIASQYQSLKDQLNPHFLFNSLNVLSNLVYENADKSAAFIQQLSKIYRYVLDVQQEELVGLDQEIGFAENYLNLQKIRFEGSLDYGMDLRDTKGFYLPPLSLQLLLENAIKHNIASLEKPLQIRIEQTGDALVIRNVLQPKTTPMEAEGGIGLKNIEKRYALLSDQAPKISETDHEFIVELPLLKLSKP
ncbi:sensor histidine kinase [Pararhodonellum marinum]|uniref:sensor histidine kinase n=1 Tax=Pararhodonellum marinum TaxID=2755358 RepID=UPI00188F0F6E|nr:sensor histidine kinase [Pararhodonellum marinum]